MLFYCLTLVVLLSPLPFATNRPLFWSLWALLIAILGVISVINFFKSPQHRLSLLPFKSILDLVFIFIFTLGWIVYQAVIPAFVNTLHPIWTLADELLRIEITPPLSLASEDSFTAVMRMLSYGLVFSLSFYYSQLKKQARLVFLGVMGAGFVYSLYGVIIYCIDSKSISSVTSTFVNRNHFATFVGLTLLCTLALLNDGIAIASRHNIGGNLGLQRFFENLITRTWFPALVFIVNGTALILTHSRGGFSSSLLGIVVLLIALNLNQHTRNRYVLWTVSIFIGLGAVIFNLSSSKLLERFDLEGVNDENRAMVFELVGSAITGNPWIGFGLGSFEEAFPLYKNLAIAGTIAQPSLWDYAHNSYLEMIFELGFPAALALFYCFLRLALICLKGLLIRNRDWIYPTTGLAATVLIAAHVSVDFSMQIPAVAYIYFLLMGTACAQSFSSVKT
jgi:O-antigen ligase